MSANLGDGNGAVNQLIELRQDYNNVVRTLTPFPPIIHRLMCILVKRILGQV
jgi:hypothetical protein